MYLKAGIALVALIPSIFLILIMPIMGLFLTALCLKYILTALLTPVVRTYQKTVSSEQFKLFRKRFIIASAIILAIVVIINYFYAIALSIIIYLLYKILLKLHYIEQ